MARIDLEDTLRAVIELALLLQQAFHVHVEVALVRDSAVRAAGKPRLAAHVLHLILRGEPNDGDAPLYAGRPLCLSRLCAHRRLARRALVAVDAPAGPRLESGRALG